jgi:hypothetical protein
MGLENKVRLLFGGDINLYIHLFIILHESKKQHMTAEEYLYSTKNR